MNNKLNQNIDKKIKNYLNNKAEEISASEDMFFKIRAEILKQNKGVFYNMKIRFLRARTAIIAGLICIVTTGTCVAATNGSFWVGSSSLYNDIKVFPTSDTVKSKVDFIPKYVENFDGGFKFDTFNYSNSSLKNDDGSTIIKTKDAHFYYKKDGARKDQDLFLNATAIDQKYFNEDGNVKSNSDVTEYKGIKIYYNSIKRKIVPEGYKQTEEDLKLINEGRLDMAFGSDEIEEYNSKSVKWYENGIEYSIINNSYDDVNREAMINMAKDVINK
jgi:hypothetical protein